MNPLENIIKERQAEISTTAEDIHSRIGMAWGNPEEVRSVIEGALEAKDAEIVDTARAVAVKILEEARKEMIDLIDGLKIDEKERRGYLLPNGDKWEVKTYIEKQLVNAAYFHVQRVIRDYTFTTLKKK